MSFSTARLKYFNNISWYLLLTCICSYYCQINQSSPQQDCSRLHRRERKTQLTVSLLNYEPCYVSFVITYVENLAVFCFVIATYTNILNFAGFLLLKFEEFTRRAMFAYIQGSSVIVLQIPFHLGIPCCDLMAVQMYSFLFITWVIISFLKLSL